MKKRSSIRRISNSGFAGIIEERVSRVTTVENGWST